jgi:peptidoglycan glycosyltransferase
MFSSDLYPYSSEEPPRARGKRRGIRRSLLLSLSALTAICVGYAVLFSAHETSALSSIPIIETQTNLTAEDREPFGFLPVSDRHDVAERAPTRSAAIESVSVQMSIGGPVISRLPEFRSTLGGRFVARTANDDYVFFSLDPDLQASVTKIMNNARSKHIAIVAIDPRNGKILAVNGRSPIIESTPLHADFPAASLFKVITSTAALERGSIRPESLIRFRGGNYALNQWNYRPDMKKDRRFMSVEEALGKSINPVFGRIALQYLNPAVLKFYVRAFGFNGPIESDIRLPESHAVIPDNDFEFSRTGAGFGDVAISPLHASAIIGALANGGKMLKLHLIDRIVSPTGITRYRSQPTLERVVMRPETARTLMGMMESTVANGTSRKDFMHRSLPMRNVRVCGKTGSLNGDNPKGFTNWFIGTAPVDRPEIAVAVVVVDDQGLRNHAASLAKLVLESYFNQH